MKYLLISLVLLTTFLGVSPVKADLASDQKKCVENFISKVTKDTQQKDIDTLYLDLKQCQEKASLAESLILQIAQSLAEKKNNADIKPVPPPVPVASDIVKNIIEQFGLSEAEVSPETISQSISDSQLRQMQARVRTTLKDYQRLKDSKSLGKYILALTIYDIQLNNLTKILYNQDCLSKPEAKVFKDKLNSLTEELTILFREVTGAQTTAELKIVYAKLQGKNVPQVAAASQGYCQGLIVSDTVEKLNKYVQDRLGGSASSEDSDVKIIIAGLAKATGLVSTSTATYEKLIAQNLNLKQELAVATEDMKLATSTVLEINKVLTEALSNIKKGACKQALFVACNLQQLHKVTAVAGLRFIGL